MAFSGTEWLIVVVVVALLFFGGAKVIPQFAKNLGRAKGEFDRAKLEVDREVATERAKSRATDCCDTCGTRLSSDDVKCLKCGSLRERPVAPPSAAFAAR